MTTLTRVLAYGLGALLVAGFVILALAGVPAARIIVITAVAVVAMIGLGSAFGGRRSSGRPAGSQDPPPGERDQSGTMGT